MWHVVKALNNNFELFYTILKKQLGTEPLKHNDSLLGVWF